MKVDLGVVSTTANDYDDVITNIGDIKSRIKNTESDLSNRGWSGEAQKKYSELVKWFLEKDYECLEENLKCIKEVLNNEAKKQGGALKNRCEDFVSCFDGSERGVYPESSGEIAGILSLEYNNSASVIDNVTQITNKLIAQKRAALEDLSKTINGGWFSSGLIFSSLNIDNELAESSNEMFKEEKRLNAFLQSFVQYTPGVKRLEESVCWGLNIKLGTLGKAKGFAKTIIVDVGAGVVTCYQGCVVVAGSIFAIPVSEGLSVIGVPEGVAMVASGGNCALNRGRDLIREINGEWSEVGSTNFVKDTVSSFATKATGNNEEGNLIGVVTVLGVDTFGSVRGIVSSMSGTVKAGKSTVNGVNSLYNDYKMFGTSYKIINTRTNEAKFVKLVNTEGLAESALKVSGLTYNDTVQFYCAKTIFDDASPLLSVKNDELPMVINSWLRTD